MFNLNIKDHSVSVSLHYKIIDLDGEIIPYQYRYNTLFPGEKIFIFDNERKMCSLKLISLPNIRYSSIVVG